MTKPGYRSVLILELKSEFSVLLKPEKLVDYDAVVQHFAERYPRRMLLVDPVFEETQN